MQGFRGFCVLAAIAVLSVPPVDGQSPAGPAGPRVVAAGGVVEIFNGNTWIEALRGQPVETGQRVRTGVASFAYIVVAPDKAVTLTDQTEIQLRDTGGKPAIFLEQGSMKLEAGSEITVSTKDSTLDSLGGPVELQVTYRDSTADVSVLRGAVRSGALILRAAADSRSRTYVVGGKQRYGVSPAYPNVSVYPYVVYTDRNPLLMADPLPPLRRNRGR